MKRMKENFLNKISSDRADSVLIIFLVSVPLLILVMGFVVDLNKNVNTKIAYNSMAQTSAETAVKAITPSGSLDRNSVVALVDEYRIQSGVYKSETCSTMEVDGVEREMPYMVINLQKERGEGEDGVNPRTSNWVIEGPSGRVESKNISGQTKYRAISATVYDSSTNSFGTFGLPECQLHRSEVSAIAFGSNEDL